MPRIIADLRITADVVCKTVGSRALQLDLRWQCVLRIHP
jgi:hypothetical protein